VAKLTATTFLMVGGNNNAWKGQNGTYMFDWQTRVWTQKQDISVARSAIACALFEYSNGSQVVLAAGKKAFCVDCFSLLLGCRLPSCASLTTMLIYLALT
jgi:hypothetical protein